jgi:signal transduction histidine kinase
VEGDENRLQQIFYNLIGNAIKFTDQGEIRVAAIQVDSMVRVSVSDTGIGIPEEKFETIFQAFEQGDSASSRAYSGTGLGLSITRHLVELHGGEIRLGSEVGKGSTFYFTLPMSDGLPGEDNLPAVSRVVNDTPTEENFLLPSAANPQPAALDTPPSNRDPYQVLVVDDDPVNLQVAANHLLLENISFQTASDGRGALERIESGERPHVLLLDIMMPKITGYEVCRRLRETFSPSELPIIMLTAKTHVADLVEAYKAGASDYLSKPFSKDELISRVRCHLDLRGSYANFVEKQRLEREVLQQKQKKQMARLQAEKEKLEKLRYQLNPHFLFNALASIRGAVLRDREVARELISHLAEFSRLTLSRGSMDTLTITEELEVIRHFMAMEQIRFGDYLTVTIEIDPNVEKIQVPALVLQPLVENAVKYGSRTSPDALEVTISAKTQPPDMIRLEIENSGRWVEPGTTDSKYSTGTGIENVKQRLEKYYASRYRFETRAEGGQVTIEIDVPRVILI